MGEITVSIFRDRMPFDWRALSGLFSSAETEPRAQPPWAILNRPFGARTS
jgi:hypothetical protein